MRCALPLLLALLAGCATQQSYMGYPVQNAQFNIAGGQTVLLPITPVGPIPAQTEDYKIEFVGPVVGPSEENPNRAELSWHFAFTNKSSRVLKSVLIEEVFPATTAVPFVHDEAPVVKSNVWQGGSGPIEASKVSTPWLFDPNTSRYVFRFTIKAAGQPDAVLYQPAYYSAQSKTAFLQMIEKIGGD